MDKKEGLIVANGQFPENELVLSLIQNSENVICCDGAIEELHKRNITPIAIVGDLDSVPKELKQVYSHLLHYDSNQNNNDLTKAVEWASENNFNKLIIVGATGKREDHTLGNISLLAQYSKYIEVSMYTDTGIFEAINSTRTFKSFPGQQISIFSLTPETKISSENLKYPLQNLQLKSWWMGTLNECIGDEFMLSFDGGEIIIFRKY